MARPRFDTAGPRSTAGGFFEFSNLSDGEKRNLCEGLLSEFGARHVKVAGDEIIHSCVLPLGGHSNGDNHPSASINWKKLTYNCLGCGNSGGLLWFIGVCRGTETGIEAREWLAKQTGIGGVQDLDALIRFIDDALAAGQRGYEAIPIPHYDQRVLQPWRLIHPYLTEMRRIPVDNVVRHNVGWDGQRIVIPHFWRGELVGWQGRLLMGDGPKYKSTPDFPKDQTIFNYDPKAPVTVVVESPMSVIARSHQAHMEATFGAKVTDRQLSLLSNHQRIVLFFDPDDAGWSGTERMIDYLMQRTADLWVVDNPYRKADAADLDDATFERLLADPVHCTMWTRPDPSKLIEWKDPRDEEVRIGQGAEGR